MTLIENRVMALMGKWVMTLIENRVMTLMEME
jgi:hypothetical protein